MYVYIALLTIVHQCLLSESVHPSYTFKTRDVHLKKLFHNRLRAPTIDKRFFEFNPVAFDIKNPNEDADTARFYHFSPFVSLPKVEEIDTPIPPRRKLGAFKSGYMIGNEAPKGLKPYVDHFSGIRSFALHLFRPKKKVGLGPKLALGPHPYMVTERSSDTHRADPFFGTDAIAKPGQLFRGGKASTLPTDSIQMTTNNGGSNQLDNDIFQSVFQTNGIELKSSRGHSEVLNMLPGNHAVTGKSFNTHHSGSGTEFKSSQLSSGKQDTLTSINYGFGFHDGSLGHGSQNDQKLQHNPLPLTPDHDHLGFFSNDKLDHNSDTIEQSPQQISHEPSTISTGNTDAFGSLEPYYSPDYFENYQPYDGTYGESQDGSFDGFGGFGGFATESVCTCLTLYIHVCSFNFDYTYWCCVCLV